MKLLASRLHQLRNDVQTLLDQLHFASREEYIDAASAAVHDVKAATISSWKLAYISFRPVFIFLGILGHYLAIVLRIIAKHSVAHGWIAAREGYFQLRTATIWFIQFQNDLPTSAKYAELGALAIIALMWLLRRHVKKRQYVERLSAWYIRKKRVLIRNYLNFVERLARTSSVLALLLPHLLYVVLVIGTKRVAPSIVTYFATRTYLCSIISFWQPLYLTYSVLGRLSPHLMDFKAAAAISDENNNASSTRTARTMTASKLKQKQQREMEVEMMRPEVIDLLKYWVVYSVIHAIVRTGSLLPFIGRIFTVAADSPSPTKVQGLVGRLLQMTNIRFSQKFVYEISLVFFVWLRLMPSSIAGDEVKDKVTKVLAPAGLKEVSESKRRGKSSRPLDLLYDRLAPVVLSAMSSTAFLTKRAFGESSRNNRGSSTLASVVIQKMQSFLDLFVMVRLIRAETKDWVINTITEGSALLPAVPTLLMPSYFTQYGVIYVSLIVPAGYSISSCNSIQNLTRNNIETMMPRIEDATRYLQFWMVHAAFSALITSFAPILAWIPLSTHVTWLLWAYVQLQSSTRKIMSWFESEFGKKSLGETVVVQSIMKIIAALPSDVKENSDSGVVDDHLVASGEKRKSD
ncbi:hypothetical protein ACHAWU_000511 [Discostella pseudostelligera]|uniref:Uncharacterized protein n=1 Tax=Discostella pseudostelligera TaxID=259834 RepID=A0ABD3M5V0_9STRA